MIVLTLKQTNLRQYHLSVRASKPTTRQAYHIQHRTLLYCPNHANKSILVSPKLSKSVVDVS